LISIQQGENPALMSERLKGHLVVLRTKNFWTRSNPMARKPKIPEHVNHERWLVSYADFITLLFAFFTVLYATAQTDSGKSQ
jgi:hypothetical protein